MEFWRLSPLVLLSGAMLAGVGCARSQDSGTPDWTTAPLDALEARVSDSLLAVRRAAGSLPRPARIVSASERCAIGEEGEPDCRDAAARVCRTRGFDAGRAVDTASINACRPDSLDQLQSGDGPSCRIKYKMTAALCW